MKFRSIKDVENFVPKKGSFKHTLRKIEEDGRIVKGVNTTADVGTDEIKVQAAKFGNTVDKDGRPPTLSKKVRGSSTNVLFNLKEHVESVDKTDDDVLQYSMLEAKLDAVGQTSEIYVDMDGVLADFFGEWAKVMKVDHYSKIDNVDINVALQKIRDTNDFWLNLPMLPQAKQLLSLIKKVKGSYNICSSPLADDPNSEPHKREWIKKNLSFFPPKEVIITSNKPKYATQSDGTPNILIDDFGKNVNAWEAAGGEGFKYKDHKFERTAKELQQHMNEPATEGKHIPNPKNAFITKADTAYDFVKLGTNLANLKAMPTGSSNVDEPDIMIAPYAGRKEMKYLQKELKRIGYDVQDADGYQDAHYDEKPTGGKAPPQVKNEGRLGKLKLSKLRPVQKKRKFSKLFNQLKRIGEDNMSPITVDKHGHIVNGHHRYDALRLMGEEYATVRMLDVHVSETLDENFADGKKKGKSKPGRVKKSGASCNGSVTSLRTKAKKYSGEKAKMYHWCANMKSGRKKSK
jgi:5'(3')-deoxyribonucleotidase